MRLRNVRGAKEKLKSYPQHVVIEPEEYKNRWNELFGNHNPICVEVGTGKGQFITGMAKQHPEMNFIGIELFDSVAVRALDKLIDADLPNVKLLNQDAANLINFFGEAELSRIYLNFSDPWPKNRHEKRRLTYKDFLKVYQSLLIPNGEIHFKTDNQGLFEYSLASFSEYGMLLKELSLDLHNSSFVGNVQTEYEEKFSGLGQRIFRCEVQFRD